MKKGIIGRKLGMTQIFFEDGKMVPVTVIEAGPCAVTQKKTVEKDGYSAVQLGFKDIPERKLTKPEIGHLAKAGAGLKKYIKEFRLDNVDGLNVGDVVTAETFAVGDSVDIVGISKGKGFSGTIKRWGTRSGPSAHGSGYHRGQGSMGANSDPSRVMKGKVMPGQLGNEQVTIQNLTVIKVDAEKNLLVVKGAVPGPKGGIVFVKDTVKSN